MWPRQMAPTGRVPAACMPLGMLCSSSESLPSLRFLPPAPLFFSSDSVLHSGFCSQLLRRPSQSPASRHCSLKHLMRILHSTHGRGLPSSGFLRRLCSVLLSYFPVSLPRGVRFESCFSSPLQAKRSSSFVSSLAGFADHIGGTGSV